MTMTMQQLLCIVNLKLLLIFHSSLSESAQCEVHRAITWPNSNKSCSLWTVIMWLCWILPDLSLCSSALSVSMINRLLYFSSSSVVPRSLTSSISSHLCCCTHTEIRRPTVISAVMPQWKHQQLSLKAGQLLLYVWTETWTNYTYDPTEQETAQ